MADDTRRASRTRQHILEPDVLRAKLMELPLQAHSDHYMLPLWLRDEVVRHLKSACSESAAHSPSDQAMQVARLALEARRNGRSITHAERIMAHEILRLGER